MRHTFVPSGSGMVRQYFLCSSSRRIRVPDPRSSASSGSSRSVILTVRHETTSLFPWKLTCMSSFLTRGRSKIAVTVSPSADSRYFTLDSRRKHRSGSRSGYTRGLIVADTDDTGREGGAGRGRGRNGNTVMVDSLGFSFLQFRWLLVRLIRLRCPSWQRWWCW